MSEPRTPKEWSLYCLQQGHRERGIALRPLMCLSCASTYRLQGIGEALEQAAHLATTFESNEHTSHSEICGCWDDEHRATWSIQDRIAAAIHALKLDGE